MFLEVAQGHLNNLFLSSPAVSSNSNIFFNMNQTSANIKSGILNNSVDLFIGFSFFNGRGTNKDSASNQQKKIPVSATAFDFHPCVWNFVSWQICFRKLFAKPGKNVLPLPLKRTCRLVHVSSPHDSSASWPF